MLECGTDAQLHPLQRGSDHCPTSLHLRLPPAPLDQLSSPESESDPSMIRGERLARFLGIDPYTFPLPSTSCTAPRFDEKEKAKGKQTSMLSFFGSGGSATSKTKKTANSSATTPQKKPTTIRPATAPITSSDSGTGKVAPSTETTNVESTLSQSLTQSVSATRKNSNTQAPASASSPVSAFSVLMSKSRSTPPTHTDMDASSPARKKKKLNPRTRKLMDK